MKKAVFGLANSPEASAKIVERLIGSGLPVNEISFIYSDDASDAVFDGPFSLLSGIGALEIPGFASLIAAGPLLVALKSSPISDTLLFTTLLNAGILESDAKKYESAIKSGNLLISLHAHKHDELIRAQDILKKEGAIDVAMTTENVKSSY